MCSEFATAEVVIPQPLLHLTTRRVLTMDWLTGVKLTTLDPAEVRELVKVGQEAFLIQLLDIGFFHGGEGEGFRSRLLSLSCWAGCFLLSGSPAAGPPTAASHQRPNSGPCPLLPTSASCLQTRTRATCSR